MGTRSLTIIVDDSGDEPREIAVIYRQFDGYPSGHGAELAEILKPLRIGNGISGDATNYANGPSCLAAQIVTGLKSAVADATANSIRGKSMAGGIYLEPAGTRDSGEDYVYTVTANYERINLKAEKAGWKETLRKDKNNRYVERAKPIVHPPVTLYDGLASAFTPEACEVAEKVAEKVA